MESDRAACSVDSCTAHRGDPRAGQAVSSYTVLRDTSPALRFYSKTDAVFSTWGTDWVCRGGRASSPPPEPRAGSRSCQLSWPRILQTGVSSAHADHPCGSRSHELHGPEMMAPGSGPRHGFGKSHRSAVTWRHSHSVIVTFSAFS